jgi:hypothetical protein
MGACSVDLMRCSLGKSGKAFGSACSQGSGIGESEWTNENPLPTSPPYIPASPRQTERIEMVSSSLVLLPQLLLLILPP